MYESVGVNLNNGYGLFIQIDELDRELHYFIEFNRIEEDDGWNPLDTEMVYFDVIDLDYYIERYLENWYRRYIAE